MKIGVIMKKRIIFSITAVVLIVSISGYNAAKFFSRSSSESDSEIRESSHLKKFEGSLELPVIGSSAYAAVSINLREDFNVESQSLMTLKPGQGFTIIGESDEWWQIDISGTKGWVASQYCLINLPDVIPSIIYDITNSYSSKMKSSGRAIPNITGQALYETYIYNKRLDQEEYIVPVLYSMAKKINLAQQLALADKNTLIIYDAFRPYDAQMKIVENLGNLIKTDSEVKAGVTQEPWSLGWFIAQGVSNHQQGYAIDMSLGKVLETSESSSGGYSYMYVKEYEEYIMPTEIHELSVAAVRMKTPVSSRNAEAWKNTKPATTMNDKALLLQKYCTESGLTPLASEWWHFNDVSCLGVINNKWDGDFFISSNFSEIPF